MSLNMWLLKHHRSPFNSYYKATRIKEAFKKAAMASMPGMNAIREDVVYSTVFTALFEEFK